MDSSVKTVSVLTFLFREAPTFAASFLIARGVRPWALRWDRGQ